MLMRTMYDLIISIHILILMKAIKEAKFLSEDEDVLDVSVHHWILKDDGTQEHAENGDKTDIPYSFLNINHRELKEGV